MYWENQKPEYINLCIKSVEKRRGNLELHLLTPQTINTHIPNIRSEWYQLKPAHKADYIRTRLAYKYGGMWLDCDMIALQELEPLFEFPEQYDYACRKIESSIGCFIARPGCRILENIIAQQDKILDSYTQDLNWKDLGNGLLAKHATDYPYYKWKENTIDSIAGGKVSKLLSRKETIKDHVHPNAVIFHLCNEHSGYLLKSYLRNERYLTSNMLISKIFRKAFEMEKDYDFMYEWLEFIKDYNFTYAFRRKIIKSKISS